MITRNASASVMQDLRRNGVATLRAPPMTEAREILTAFEPSSRPGVPGGLLGARLRQNGGAGAPRTAGWRSGTTAKTAAQTAVTFIKRSPGTQQDIEEAPQTSPASDAATRDRNKEHGQQHH